MRRSILLSGSMVIILVSLATAEIWYVKPDGTGDVPTIQAAVDTVAPGDTVLLASGIYTGTGNYNIVVPARDLLLASETGDPADCVIDCEGHLGTDRRGLQFCSGWWARPVVRGITVRNGNVMGEGGAVECGGSPTIRSCVFDSNQSGWRGGAIAFHSSGDPVLRKCQFRSNLTPDCGGAIVIDGVEVDVTIDSCFFCSNQADRGGAICCYQHEASALIRHSVFVGNSAMHYGGAVYVGNMYGYVGHCTFHANHAAVGSGVYTCTSPMGYPSGDVRKCIIAYGTGGCGYFQPSFDPTEHGLQCTNIYGNEGGDYPDSLATKLGVDGNFSVCPAFCDAAVEPYDLSLCDQSPCLPGKHPHGYDCGLIGALGEGCICDPTRTEPSTWSAIKAMYR